jgi:hypothetical protein
MLRGRIGIGMNNAVLRVGILSKAAAKGYGLAWQKGRMLAGSGVG